MNLIIFTIVVPLVSCIILILFDNYLSDNLSSFIGVSSVGVTALLTIYISDMFFKSNVQYFNILVWDLVFLDNFNISFSLELNKLSVTMLYIVTSVGFLIHIFASWYIKEMDGCNRFFAYMNLFIVGMIVLILADNLLLMYFGWEIVGLCSYLLIDFYRSLESNKSAIKSFIITKIGDVFLVFALFIIYNLFGTLKFSNLIELIPLFKNNRDMIFLANLMLLIGAISKSAQLPLHTWLADAMIAPAPVSALIHAATMVNAGVYLIARVHNLLMLSPEILNLIRIIGASTLLLSSLIALAQTDIKRILAYSTMSQIGYMFLALGMQSWNAAIFHMMIHAFFKSLLFLAAGSLILSCNNEQNIFKIKGFHKNVILVGVCFFIGCLSLVAIPLITSGFFSKEEILVSTVLHGNGIFTFIGLIGSFITALYTFRMFFSIFHGKERFNIYVKYSVTHNLPLFILSILSTFIGTLITLPLQNVIEQDEFKYEHVDNDYILIFRILFSIVTIIGVLFAYWIWMSDRRLISKIFNNSIGRALNTCCYSAFGFNWLYDVIIVRPFLILVKFLKNDPLNILINIAVVLCNVLSRSLLISENGYIRWYITLIGVGITLLLILAKVL